MSRLYYADLNRARASGLFRSAVAGRGVEKVPLDQFKQRLAAALEGKMLESLQLAALRSQEVNGVSRFDKIRDSRAEAGLGLISAKGTVEGQDVLLVVVSMHRGLAVSRTVNFYPIKDHRFESRIGITAADETFLVDGTSFTPLIRSLELNGLDDSQKQGVEMRCVQTEIGSLEVTIGAEAIAGLLLFHKEISGKHPQSSVSAVEWPSAHAFDARRRIEVLSLAIQGIDQYANWIGPAAMDD